MKKSTLKALIQAVLTECKTCGCGRPEDDHLPENWVAKGSEKNFTPSQQAAVAKATAKGFKLISTRPEGGQTVGVLAIRIGGNVMEIEVFPNGLIRKTVGEEMTTRAELDTGLMKAVNVEDEEVVKEMTSTGAVAGYSTPFAFSKNKKGSQRALAVSKKMGFKPTGIEDKRNH